MQVKYKLQAVVNNCGVICTLDLFVPCGIRYSGSQQCDSVCYLFVSKCVDRQYGQDSVRSRADARH